MHAASAKVPSAAETQSNWTARHKHHRFMLLLSCGVVGAAFLFDVRQTSG